MNFTRTSKGIARLERESKITVTQMLDFIKRFMAETFEYNGVEGIADMEQGNCENLIINAYVLSDALVSVIKQNEESILKWDDAAELQTVFGQIKEANAELEKKSEAAKKLCAQKEILEAERERLKKQNEKLLEAQNECEMLETDIRKLDDSILADMEQRRDDLRDELATRRKKYEEINTSIRGYELKMNEMNREISKAQNEWSQREAEYGNTVKQKENLERALQELEDKKSECESWISEFRTVNDEMLRSSEEYEARYAQIYTAINSIFGEQYIKEHLFSLDGSQNLTHGNYPDLSIFPDEVTNIDDFRSWLERIQQRIKSLLGVYQEELRKLLECSVNITRDR